MSPTFSAIQQFGKSHLAEAIHIEDPVIRQRVRDAATTADKMFAIIEADKSLADIETKVLQAFFKLGLSPWGDDTKDAMQAMIVRTDNPWIKQSIRELIPS